MYQCFKAPEGIWRYGCNLVIFNKSVNEGFDRFAYYIAEVSKTLALLEHTVTVNHLK